MMKFNKLVKILAIFAIMLYTIISVNNISFAGTLSSDINGINESKYPGVKSQIKELQKKYSNYNFQVYYTGIDWTEAVTMEYQGHGSSPKNLFQLKNNYKGKWYCPICGSKTYDTGWYCASIDAIAYMMDPRNSLDETSVYQFKSLESPDASPQNIATVISKNYSSYSYINNQTIINAIVNASNQNNINGYSVLAKIVNEQGKGTSPLATGSGYNGQYVGYYNFFNIGAYGNGTSTVITNGLKYAQNKGWNSAEKSIFGGTEYYKSSYIGKGQNTLYYQRFNVINTNSLFSHQYQQDIMGAQTSAQLLKKYYTATSTLGSVKHTFIIPLFENMPSKASSRPSTTENSELIYESAKVLVNKATVKASPNSNRIISYLNNNEGVKVLKRANQKSADGKYWDTIVTDTDGTYGYIARSEISQEVSIPLPKYVFDSEYYLEKNPDLQKAIGNDIAGLFGHFVAYGISEGRASSPTLDIKYYAEVNGFGNNYRGAYEHFVNYGCNEYRKSSPEYDGSFYRYYYYDITNLSSKELIEHYINTGRKEGRLGGFTPEIESIVFDANLYATFNADIRNEIGYNEQALKLHWMKYGIGGARTASYVFDPEMYTLLNFDVQDKYGTDYRKAFEHFVRTGINELRPTSLTFDLKYYLDNNADVKKVFGTDYKQVFLHFKYFGMREGRSSSEVFDVKTYLKANPDINALYAGDNYAAYIHYFNYGMYEERQMSPTFSTAYYSKYGDLRNVYGTNYRYYYMHYLLYGKNEGRKAI